MIGRPIDCDRSWTETDMETLLKLSTNAKTTCAGVALIAISIAFLLGRLPTNDYLAAVGAIAGSGLVAARDAN
jgi:hypothetical protein